MASQLLRNSENVEREMSTYQRSLVDTCFEEGQYTSGIAVLEQLRSPHLTPSESHVRQLLYIALYPPPKPANDKVKERDNANASTPWEPVTPSKHIKQAQRSPLIPTVQASEAAIRLLKSFVLTNRPASLARALPECVGVSQWNERLRQISEEDDEDCFIAREAICIKEARSVWAILKEGKIQRKVPLPFEPQAKGKKKQRVVGFAEEDSGEQEVPAVVGEHAWPLLYWFLLLVERDEDLVEEDGSPRHSPILLSQIPPSRTNTGARWEADALLDVVVYCLEQSDHPQRKAAGARLWTALINLASTIHINLELFVTSVHGRLLSLPSVPTDWFSLMLSTLPPSERSARFKIALCKEYLTSSATPTDGALGPRPAIRPKPQARAMRAARRQGTDGDANTDDSTMPSTLAEIPVSLVNTYLLPKPEEVLKLLSEAANNSHPQDQLLKIKFDFLTSYAFMQGKQPNDNSEWTQLLRDGRVKQAIDQAFSGQGGTVYATLSRAVIL